MSGLLHALLFDGDGGARPLDWTGVKARSPNDGVLWINLDYTEAFVTVQLWLFRRRGWL